MFERVSSILTEIGFMVIAYFLLRYLFWKEDKIDSLLHIVTMFMAMWLADRWIKP